MIPQKPRTREALAMLRFALAGLAAVALVTTAGATNTLRFKLKPGWTKARALAYTETKANRTAGFSGADCWLSDGNRRLGWRHGNCVGNYTYGGTPYRFKVVYTPISCTKEQFVLTIPGVSSQRKIVTPPRDGGFRIVC
jgi:hypothetical protein